jgi:hypothetical protein
MPPFFTFLKFLFAPDSRPQEITKFARQVKDPLGETKSNMFFSYMV